MNLPYRLPYKDDNDDRPYTVNPDEKEDLEKEVDESEERAGLLNDFESQLRA